MQKKTNRYQEYTNKLVDNDNSSSDSDSDTESEKTGPTMLPTISPEPQHQEGQGTHQGTVGSGVSDETASTTDTHDEIQQQQQQHEQQLQQQQQQHKEHLQQQQQDQLGQQEQEQQQQQQQQLQQQKEQQMQQQEQLLQQQQQKGDHEPKKQVEEELDKPQDKLTFDVPLYAICGTLRSSEEIETNRLAAIERRRLRELENQGTNEENEVSGTEKENVTENGASGESERKEEDCEPENTPTTGEDETVDGEKEEEEEMEVLVDSVLNMLDDIDGIINVDTQSILVQCDRCSEWEGKLKDLEQKKVEETKKNDRLQTVLKAQEALLKTKVAEIQDLQKSHSTPAKKEVDFNNNLAATVKGKTEAIIKRKDEEIATLAKELSGKVEVLEEKNRCIEELTKQVEEINLLRVLAGESKKELRNKDDQLERIRMECENSKNQKIKEVQDIEKRLKQKEDSVENVQKDLRCKEEMIKKIKADLETKDKEINKCKTEVRKSMMKKNQEDEAELEKKDVQLKKTDDKINKIQDELKKKDKAYERLDDKICRIEDALKKKENDHENLRLKQEVEQLRDENTRVKNEIKALKENNSPMKEQSELQRFKRQVLKDIDMLKNRDLGDKRHQEQGSTHTGNAHSYEYRQTSRKEDTGKDVRRENRENEDAHERRYDRTAERRRDERMREGSQEGRKIVTWQEDKKREERRDDRKREERYDDKKREGRRDERKIRDRRREEKQGDKRSEERKSSRRRHEIDKVGRREVDYSSDESIYEITDTSNVKRYLNVRPQKNNRVHIEYESEGELNYVPGHRSYRDTVREGRKIVVFSSSITKGIDNKAFNDDLHGSSTAEFVRWPGKKAEHIKNDVKPHLTQGKPQAVIIQAGGNDFGRAPFNGDVSVHEIADHLIETADACKRHGVRDIYIGGVVTRKGLQKRIFELNDILKEKCRLRGFNFIDNENIFIAHLYDGVHLNAHGSNILKNNYLSALSDFEL